MIKTGRFILKYVLLFVCFLLSMALFSCAGGAGDMHLKKDTKNKRIE